jgi:hypothetical protein
LSVKVADGGKYGHVKLRLAPLPQGDGFTFDNVVVGGVIPQEYIPAIQTGVVEAMQHGIVAGCPVVDVKVCVYDGSYHEVESSKLAFKIAASMAVKEIARKAEPFLLEPIMDVEVVVPDAYMGDVLGDLASLARCCALNTMVGVKAIAPQAARRLTISFCWAATSAKCVCMAANSVSRKLSVRRTI